MMHPARGLEQTMMVIHLFQREMMHSLSYPFSTIVLMVFQISWAALLSAKRTQNTHPCHLKSSSSTIIFSLVRTAWTPVPTIKKSQQILIHHIPSHTREKCCLLLFWYQNRGWQLWNSATLCAIIPHRQGVRNTYSSRRYIWLVCKTTHWCSNWCSIYCSSWSQNFKPRTPKCCWYWGHLEWFLWLLILLYPGNHTMERATISSGYGVWLRPLWLLFPFHHL